jgi:hypothetical protein
VVQLYGIRVSHHQKCGSSHFRSAIIIHFRLDINKWITRIPGTLNEVKELYKSITPEQMQESEATAATTLFQSHFQQLANGRFVAHR